MARGWIRRGSGRVDISLAEFTKWPPQRVVLAETREREDSQGQLQRGRQRDLPFDPSSWATGRVGNFGARWFILATEVYVGARRTAVHASRQIPQVAAHPHPSSFLLQTILLGADLVVTKPPTA